MTSPSSSTSNADVRNSRHDDESSNSSSGSESERESEKRLKKKIRKEEKKRTKKDSKSKKEKKDKKEKKEKKSKSDRDRGRDKESNGKRSSSSNSSSSSMINDGSSAPALTEHDAIEMASFRQAVQGKQILVANEREQANLLNASREDIAASLGLPKGLIRTSLDDNSITQRYSRDLFGGDDDNPAKRQRLNRERIAKRALEIARSTLNAKADADRIASMNPNNNKLNQNQNSGLSDIMNRFSSSKKGIS